MLFTELTVKWFVGIRMKIRPKVNFTFFKNAYKVKHKTNSYSKI